MRNTEYSRQFQARGFLVIEDFFSPALMDTMDAKIRDYYGDSPEFRHEEEFLE